MIQTGPVAADTPPEQTAAANARGGPRAASSGDQVAALCQRLNRALRAGEPVGWAVGLSVTQVRVLWLLSRVGATSVSEVAANLGVAQPSATETLDRLVCRGYVGRESDPSDRRVVRNVLTPAGRAILDGVLESRRTLLDAALRRATPEDRAAIIRGLTLLVDLLESPRTEGASQHALARGRRTAPNAQRPTPNAQHR